MLFIFKKHLRATLYKINGWNPSYTYLRGVPVSRPQLLLAQRLGIPRRFINYPVSRLFVDIVIPELNIAVEYDGWPWHNPEKDKKRDKVLFNEGWKVLHIRSGSLVPTLDELEGAIQRLSAPGVYYEEIVMEDWKRNMHRVGYKLM